MTETRHAAYHDPLDEIWLAACSELNIRVVRSADVYASWDGRGTLSICENDAFDPDDSLAQLIFHELCHALVQGPQHRHKVDWGLDNEDNVASAIAEHAAHRLQAALLDRYGLRPLLAVTTDWRPYWDALPADPLAPGDDPAVALARAAWPDAVRGPWSGPIDKALRATAAIGDVVRAFAPAGSLWRHTTPTHPVSGFALISTERCGSCAWRDIAGNCVIAADEGASGPTVSANATACIYHERALDCASCGACCRQAFASVPIAPDEPLAATPPAGALPDLTDGGWQIPRPEGYCIALQNRHAPWLCSIYANRPRACREFEVAGTHCLIARRRVGLTRL